MTGRSPIRATVSLLCEKENVPCGRSPAESNPKGGSQLRISVEHTRDAVLVRLAGELDEHSAAQFRETVEHELDESGSSNLLLDLSEVSFIDSSGLGALLGRYKRVSQAEGKMAITGASTQVRRILELSGVLRIIPLGVGGSAD